MATQSPPLEMWMTSHRQCPRGGGGADNVQGGGGCLWMSQSRGVFQFSGGRMTSRRQCPRGGWVGGGACGMSSPPFRKSCIRACYLWKNFGQINPSAPLTKAFPYAYGCGSTNSWTGVQGPQKGRSLEILKLTSQKKKNSEGGGSGSPGS